MSEDIEESAALALNSLQRERSKYKYKKACKEFENWCLEKTVKDINEEETDDNKYLLMKVVLLIEISGGLRREEITFLDIKYVKVMKLCFLIEILHTKTNVRKEFPITRGNFDGISQKIAEFLKLRNSSTYTGHCFRRTSAILLADAEADITLLKRHGNWKSSSFTKSYIENSIENKLEITSKYLGNPSHKVVRKYCVVATPGLLPDWIGTEDTGTE